MTMDDPQQTAPMLHLDGFDGPMDLLLDLAERQRIDLGRLSIVALAEQFVAALTALGSQVPLDRRAEWVVLAARLVQLRARLLFPLNPEAAEAAQRDAAAELRQLRELGFLRAAGGWLAARPQLGWDVFAPPGLARDPRREGFMALMEACLAVLRGGTGAAEAADEAMRMGPDLRDVWPVSAALARIRAGLDAHPQGGKLTSYVPALPAAGPRDLTTRAAIASTLLASLELAREGAVDLVQEAPWEEIQLSATPPP
jgi:segregation and condensation protein A